jgi:hypothetical protein
MQKQCWLFYSGTLFVGLLMLLLLGACAEVKVTCTQAAGAARMVQNDDGTGGCPPPTPWANQPATGFVGLPLPPGPSPVPYVSAPNTWTCDSTGVKCSNEGQGGCSLRDNTKKCRTTFTYPSSGKLGQCLCQCIN